MKYRLFCVLMLLGLISSSSRLWAQVFEPFNPYGDLTPSVNSWSMIKYGGITPSLYTGAMSWSLPLYTYSDPDFNIPVSLEYNYDGFRPARPSGEVGLGWALNCGGIITREVRGVPDEQDASSFEPGYFVTDLTGYYHTVRNTYLMSHREEGYSSYTNWSVKNNRLRSDFEPISFIENNRNELLDISNGGLFDPFMDQPGYAGTHETTPDVFHFSVMGLTGDFCIAPDTSIKVFNTNVPYGTLKVEIFDVGRPDYVHQLMTVRITDQDGFQYFFGGSIPATEYNESASGDSFDQHYNWGETLVITALKLSRIVAPNGRSAEFTYSSQTQCDFSRSLSRRSVLIHYNDTIDGSHYGDRNIPDAPLQSIRMQYSSPLESVIVDGKTVLLFDYVLRTYDENDANYYAGTWIPGCLSFTNSFSCRPAVRISSLQARNKDNETVEHVSFSHGYATSGTPKMFLDSLTVRSKGKYAFLYTNRSGLPVNDVKATDYWGFWNQRGFLSRSDLNYNSESLYNQFTSTAVKAPDYARTLAGALERITYPTGGYTEIEYEENEADKLIETNLYDTPHLINNNSDFAVGGIRVKSLTDVTGSSRDTTRFEYDEGTLLQMPDYYTLLDYKYYNNDMGLIHFNLVKFFVGCPENSPRSNFITYGSVKTIYPDRSYTRTHFRDYRTDPDRYLSTAVDTIRAFDKNIYCERNTVANSDCTLPHDVYRWHGYPNTWNISGFNKVIVEDLSPVRGKTSCIQTYSAEGTLKKKEEYDYDLESVHRTDWQWFNDISRFYAVRRKCYSPLMTEIRTTVYENGTGILTREIDGYNSRGQLFYKGILHPEGSTDALHFRYCHEVGLTNPSRLDNLLSDAVKTRSEGNQKWITSAERYTYDSLGCKFPTKIQSKIFESPLNVSSLNVSDYFSVTPPSTRMSTFSYNGKHRLTCAVLPGGATIDYTWDPTGKYILSKSVNGPDNVISFEWKDLVGLTQVTDPSGQTERYEYDARNRPWKTFDTDSLTVSVYYYKLKNE